MKFIINFLQYFLTFLIIVECNSIYGYFIKPSIKGSIIATIFFILSTINILIRKQPIKKMFQIAIYVVVWEIIAFILLQLADDKVVFSFKYILIVPLIFFYFAITPYSQILNFLRKFTKIMFVLAIISMVMWLLCSILLVVNSTGMVPVEWGELIFFKSYYNLYFETQQYDFGSIGQFTRNTGIFVEAPMYNFCLCVALGIELFLNSSKSNKVICTILTICILSTFSTTGQIFLIFVFFVKYFILKSDGRLKKLGIMVVFIPVGLALSFFIIQTILSEKAKGASFKDRKGNIESNIRQWNKSPFLGNGNNTARQENNSNSFFLLLQEGGILMVSFYILALVILPLYKSFKTKNYNFFVFFALIFYLFCITIVLYNYFLILFLSLGFALNLIKSDTIDNKKLT